MLEKVPEEGEKDRKKTPSASTEVFTFNPEKLGWVTYLTSERLIDIASAMSRTSELK